VMGGLRCLRTDIHLCFSELKLEVVGPWRTQTPLLPAPGLAMHEPGHLVLNPELSLSNR
jgi:hypothetical protein